MLPNTISGMTTGGGAVKASAQHSALLMLAGGLVATYIFFWVLLHVTHDPKEPPLVSTAIPFISPIIKLKKWNMTFYQHMKEKYPNLPIYTLRLPGTRMYVVNATHLIPDVQRRWRSLPFSPVSIQAFKVAMGGSQEAVDIMSSGIVSDGGYFPDFNKAIHSSLSPGHALDDMNLGASQVLAASLDDIIAQKGPRTVKLFEWIGHELTMATTDSIYGPNNPLRDPATEADWLTFHPSIIHLVLNLPLSNVLFRRVLAARDRLINAFLRYHTAGHYNDSGASAYIQAWTKHSVDRGVPPADIARIHVGNLFALVTNTVTSTFWTVAELVAAGPDVLHACRAELRRAMSVQQDAEGVGGTAETCTLRARAVVSRTHCPTLLALFQEVLRVHSMVNSVRIAHEDCLLDDGRYLVKKGGVVMIPARVQHRLREVWGEDAETFDHTRWLSSTAHATDLMKKKSRRANPVAFRGFGGGTTLCPGRHFATTEILLFTAMLVLRFDVVRADGGPWVMPTTKKSSQAEAMEQPDQDIEVELRPQSGADRKWRVSFEADGKGDAALVVEDL